ncbi:hypothetical protein DPEC_G00166580, partial [Dallia pectoralis]
VPAVNASNDEGLWVILKATEDFPLRSCAVCPHEMTTIVILCHECRTWKTGPLSDEPSSGVSMPPLNAPEEDMTRHRRTAPSQSYSRDIYMAVLNYVLVHIE